jgi:hypothetical protein
MASINAYNDGKKNILNATIDLDGDTIKVALVTSTYSPDIDNDADFGDITNELAASGGYTARGQALDNLVITADDVNNRAVLDGDDETFSALTPSAPFRYGIIYKDTGTDATSFLIAYIDFEVDQDSNGSDYTIEWNSSGILYI